MAAPDPETDPHVLEGKFEPESKGVRSSLKDAALTSIAVSLKRIADKFDGGHGHELEDMLFNAGRAFENGRRQVR